MYQQITIETLNAQRLKPVLEDAIQSQLADVEIGIQKTRAKLQESECCIVPIAATAAYHV